MQGFYYLSLDGVWQFVNREIGEVAPADVEVVRSGERQRPRRYAHGLLLPAGGHSAAQGQLSDTIPFVSSHFPPCGHLFVLLLKTRVSEEPPALSLRSRCDVCPVLVSFSPRTPAGPRAEHDLR